MKSFCSRIVLVAGAALALAASAWGQEYTFTYLAGSTGWPGARDGVGSVARFNSPDGVAVDSSGTVYVADSFNSKIRKIAPDGNVTTLAGLAGFPGCEDGVGRAARFNQPSGVAVDNGGNVYVADTLNHTIRKITPDGTVNTIAGLAGQHGSADGTGAAARFHNPSGAAVDNSGNVYVADSSTRTIRKITPDGTVSTLAGLPGENFSADGADGRPFFWTQGLAVDNSRNVYVADSFTSTIWKITPGGTVSTLAGLGTGEIGSADGTGSAARFFWPQGLAVDNSGNVYLADSWNHTIRKVTPDGIVSTLAGLVGSTGSADGTGSAARFFWPKGLAVDNSGNVYVADSFTSTIRKVTPNGTVSTLAGLARENGSADGAGTAARFDDPEGLAVDNSGNVYVADSRNSTIRKIAPGGTVSTMAGLAGQTGSADGTGSNARFYYPNGLAVDNSGNVYVADTSNRTIRKVTPDGTVSTLAGLAGQLGSEDGAGSAARFNAPRGVAVDSSGNIFVADEFSHTIRKITPDGTVSTLAGLAGKLGSADGTGSNARFYDPWGVAVDKSGNVFVADLGNSTIRKITPDGIVSTLAGLAGSNGSADGTGSAARFFWPQGLAVDNGGNVYVADFINARIRMINSEGLVTTVARLEWMEAHKTEELFENPSDIAVDGLGRIYVAELYKNAIAVGIPLAITQEPVSQGAYESESIVFKAEASSRIPVTYQWRFNGTDLPNETNEVLTLAGVTLAQTGDYSVQVSNLTGSVISRVAAATVIPGTFNLAITSPPQSQTVNPGATVILTVAAIGNPSPAYQWRRNGEDVLGANRSTLTLVNVQPSDGGRYTVVVSNFRGARTSQPADVVVTSPALALADNLADRATASAASGVGSGNNRNATSENGEPRHAGKPGGKSVWYAWRAPANGIATFSTRGSGFDTLLAVYTGTGLANLTEVAADDEEGGYLTSQVRYNAQQGVEYLIAIDGFAGASGDIVLSWELDTTITDLPRFTLQPKGQTVTPGDSVTFSVVAVSQTAVTYQWFRNCLLIASTNNPTATNSTLQIASVSKDAVGLYFVRVSNKAGQIADSRSAALEIGPPDVKVQSQDKYGDILALESGGVQPLLSGKLSAMELSGVHGGGGGFASVSAGVLGTQLLDNFGSTTEQDEPSAGGIARVGASRWYQITAAEAGTLVVDTVGSAIDTFLAVYAPPQGKSLLELEDYLVGADDNGAPDGVRSLVRVKAAAGTRYLIYVAGVNGEEGSISLNWGLGQEPVITVAPGSKAVRVGSPLTLSVTANGNPAPSYRWYWNGGLVGSGSALEYRAFQAENAGRYRVVVGNGIGVATADAIITARSPLRLGDNGVPMMVGGRFQMPVAGADAGHVIVIETSADLIQWSGVWTNAAGTVMNFQESEGAGPTRFYRAVER